VVKNYKQGKCSTLQMWRGKKERNLFFIGFPVFIELVWLGKRTQNMQIQSKEEHIKKINQSHAYQAPSWTSTWRTGPSNKNASYSIGTLIGTICITFFFWPLCYCAQNQKWA